MTTSVPQPPAAPPPGAADPRAVRAWSVYRESLRGLSGPEYERAEVRAWERLQRALAETERAGELVG